MSVRGCIDDNIKYLSHALPQSDGSSSSDTNNASSAVDPKEFYAEIVVMLWKLAHCAMNVELTEDREDDDEKVSDRETIESVENLRQFLLVQLHNEWNRKFV